MELSEALQTYRFALLPQRIQRQDAEKDWKKNEDTERFDVQCQICGRMGTMTIEDMQKHVERHGREQKKQEGRKQI